MIRIFSVPFQLTGDLNTVILPLLEAAVGSSIFWTLQM